MQAAGDGYEPPPNFPPHAAGSSRLDAGEPVLGSLSTGMPRGCHARPPPVRVQDHVDARAEPVRPRRGVVDDLHRQWVRPRPSVDPMYMPGRSVPRRAPPARQVAGGVAQVAGRQSIKAPASSSVGAWPHSAVTPFLDSDLAGACRVLGGRTRRVSLAVVGKRSFAVTWTTQSRVTMRSSAS